MRSKPLLAPLAALAAGVLVSRLAVFQPRELLWSIAALSALALAAALRDARRTAMFGCLCALGLAGTLVAVAHRPGPPPELDAGSREVVIASGCVVAPPIFFDDREQFVLELAPQARARVSLYLREGEQAPVLRYGQRVELEARFRRARNFQNPGSFDYAGYLARQDIYWTASSRPSTVRILEGACGTWFEGLIFRLRTAALERLERLYAGYPYETAMTQAVLIGESSRLEKVWTEDFRRTGTYHVLVISGLHIAVLAGFFLFLLRLCFCPQSVALALTTLAGWLYALVSGWQAPVVRGAAGFTLFVAARFFYRKPQLLNLVAAAAIGFLVCDPEQMFEPSFQLSFLSVAAIGALAVPFLERTSAPLTRGLPGLADVDRDPHLDPRTAHFRVELRLIAETVELWTRAPRAWVLRGLASLLRVVFYVFEMVAVSALVQIGLVLPMAIYFHRLSITGLSANVLIVPLMSAVVPFGFVAIFTGWSLAAKITSLLLAGARFVAAWHVRWEPAWRIPGPPIWLAAAFTLALLGYAFFDRRSAALRAIFAGATAALLAIVVWHPFPPRVTPGVLELSDIDVGQAESLFLALPDGKLMLVDGGGIPAIGRRRSRLDIGEDVVSPYLWSRSIRRLDAIVLSHAHEDHAGGIPALIENFRPKELWTGAVPPEDPLWMAVRAAALRCGVKMVTLARGTRLSYGGTRIEVLAPPAGDQPGALASNEDSLVLRLSYGHHALLLTGDLPRRQEMELVSTGLIGKSDVLKVAHHGSRTSTGPEFLDAARPAVALISAGFENSYGFPHPQLLERLHERRAAVLRTDLWGLVSVVTDGKRLRLDTARWSEDGRQLYSAF